MATGPASDKVCPFRLSRIAEFPTGGVMSVGKELACFREKCELWQTHEGIQGCSLRTGTMAAIGNTRK
jgi:hypothetical protein